MLIVAVSAQSFFQLFNEQNMPNNWIAGIADRQGRIVSRVRGAVNDGQYIGQLASESCRNLKDQNGVFELYSLEGEPILAARTHSATGGLVVGVAVKKAAMQAPAWYAFRWAMIVGGGSSILSLVFAIATARSIAGPINRLRNRASALLAGAPSSLPVFGPPEIKELSHALQHSAAALRESEERLRLANEAASIGTFSIDLPAGQASYSSEVSAMLGVPGVATASVEMALTRVHRDDQPRVRTLYGQLIASSDGGQVKMDFRFVRPGGEVRWMTWIGRAKFHEGQGAQTPYRIVGACLDITERKVQEEHISLLMREVNHRSKNMLSLVQAIARQTHAASPDDFLDRFEKRVQALAANQDLLVKNTWKGVDLNELVRSQLAHFEDLIGSRIKLQGPALFVTSFAAQALGMALHELATNAGKYGALAESDGRVAIEWELQEKNMGAQIFAMRWREQGGRPVAPPSKQGFGSTVIREMAELSLDAKVELAFPASGLIWQLQCPATQILQESNSIGSH
jgi:PAS domain S-box-containing protein